MKKPEGTVTGRINIPGPSMQFLKPALSSEQAEMVGAIKGAFIGMDLATRADKSAGVIYSRRGTHMVVMTGDKLTVDAAWINGLNANRKPDRAALAMVFRMIAEHRGAIVEERETDPTPGFSGRGIALRIRTMGVGVMLDVNNLFGGRYALLHWRNDYTQRPAGQRGARDFLAGFALAVKDGSAIRGGRPRHHATTCGNDWWSIAMALDSGLKLAASGSAFAEAPAA